MSTERMLSKSPAPGELALPSAKLGGPSSGPAPRESDADDVWFVPSVNQRGALPARPAAAELPQPEEEGVPMSVLERQSTRLPRLVGIAALVLCGSGLAAVAIWAAANKAPDVSIHAATSLEAVAALTPPRGLSGPGASEHASASNTALTEDQSSATRSRFLRHAPSAELSPARLAGEPEIVPVDELVPSPAVAPESSSLHVNVDRQNAAAPQRAALPHVTPSAPSYGAKTRGLHLKSKSVFDRPIAPPDGFY
ncbi:MAG TPA: hypothetical protein VFQ61_16930 [Polyangiaceae bacterium]|nr:hypothetical protein [Polyangiaceae bacterium]